MDKTITGDDKPVKKKKVKKVVKKKASDGSSKKVKKIKKPKNNSSKKVKESKEKEQDDPINIAIKELIEWIDIFDIDMLAEAGNINALMDKIESHFGGDDYDVTHELFSCYLGLVKKIISICGINSQYTGRISNVLIKMMSKLDINITDFFTILGFMGKSLKLIFFGNLTRSAIIDRPWSFYNDPNDIAKIKKYVLSNLNMAWEPYHNFLERTPAEYFDNKFVDSLVRVGRNAIDGTTFGIFCNKGIIISKESFEQLVRYCGQHLNIGELLKNIPIDKLNADYLNLTIVHSRPDEMNYLLGKGVKPDNKTMENACNNLNIKLIKWLSEKHGISIDSDTMYRALELYRCVGSYHVHITSYYEWLNNGRLCDILQSGGIYKVSYDMIDVRYEAIQTMLDTNVILEPRYYMKVYRNDRMTELLMAFRCPLDYDTVGRIMNETNGTCNKLLEDITIFGLEYGDELSEQFIKYDIYPPDMIAKVNQNKQNKKEPEPKKVSKVKKS
jgi:hypothetical protein